MSQLTVRMLFQAFPANVQELGKSWFPSGRSLLIAAFILLAFIGRRTWSAELEAPADLSTWGLHCFCIEAVRTPHRIVRFDNNGQILYRARTGVTKQALLQAGLAVTESQLSLMLEYRLLRKDGDVLTTAFPVLGPQETSSLRPKVNMLAARITPAITADVRAIAKILHDDGFADSTYAVVFGYVLDGLLWDELRARRQLPSTKLTLEHPQWNGAFWSIYPERVGVAGTNEVESGNAALVFTWTDRVSEALRSLENAPMLPEYLAGLAEVSSRPAVLLGSDQKEWRLASDNGVLRVPVIGQRTGDPIFDLGTRIAGQAARILTEDTYASTVLASIGNATREEATLIVAHELIWDIAAQLEAKKVIRRPAILSDGVMSTDSLRSLLFVRIRGPQ
jgi:hypothetical protein